VVEGKADLPSANISQRWYDSIWVGETVWPKHKGLQGQSRRASAETPGKGIIAAFMDLGVRGDFCLSGCFWSRDAERHGIGGHGAMSRARISRSSPDSGWAAIVMLPSRSGRVCALKARHCFRRYS
jgi:hypothetical protein